jgi:benzodiazapine receptor
MRAKTLVTTVGAVQPPRQAFPSVGPILYVDIAAVSAPTLDRLSDHDRDQARAYSAVLAVNVTLNAGWTWLFSTRRQLGASGAARGLYPAWCAFATLLWTRIWQINRGDRGARDGKQ